MNRALIAAWVLIGAAALPATWVLGHRALAARDRAARAACDLALVIDQARELAAIGSQRSLANRRPATGLAPRITAVLARCGLPASSLSTFSPDSQTTPVGNSGLKRQRASLTLSAVTLPQLGVFLDAWRDSEPAWTVTGIDVAPSGNPSAPAGGDLPLRAGLTIETVFAEDDAALPGAAPARPSAGGSR